jgi:hypothetical protein
MTTKELAKMANENYVGFRLLKDDEDIKEDLKQYEDRTKRMKDVYRVAMLVESGAYVPADVHYETIAALERQTPSEEDLNERAAIIEALVSNNEPIYTFDKALQPIRWTNFPEPAKPSVSGKPSKPLLKVKTK